MSDITDPRPEASLVPSGKAELAAKAGALVSRGLEILSTSTLVSAVEPLALAIEATCGGEPSQVLRIKTHAAALARALGASEREIHAIELAALLRNIGMLAFEDPGLLASLLRPEPLTLEALRRIRLHPQAGAEIVGSTPALAVATPVLLHHHERWDGQGYPGGLKGTAIPLGARVLATVEYYEALTSGWPGDVIIAERLFDEFSSEDALKVLRQQAGMAFDPDLILLLARVLPTVDTSRFVTTQSYAVKHAFEIAREGRPRWSRRARPRVLVVDDEARICDLLAKTLALAEYHVDVALDGESALKRVEMYPYDLLITDLKMEGMDGLTLIRQARRFRAELPVIIITGYSTESSALEAVKLGVAGYLTKPFRVPQILAAAAKALGE